MKNKMVVAFLGAFLAMSTCTIWAQSPPLALGTVKGVAQLSACPVGFFPGVSCYSATVSCPNTADIAMVYGYLDPRGTPNGTIVLLSGSEGTVPENNAFVPAYVEAGYQIVQFEWETAWQDTGLTTKNVQTAACRPATFLNYVHESIYKRGGMCAHGDSAGSAAVAYSLAWYGSTSYLDKVELLSGPVLGNIAQGCVVPPTPAVTVCASGQFGCNGAPWSDNTPYVLGSEVGVRRWTGDKTCANEFKTTEQSAVAWTAMSIVNEPVGNPSFNYPKTAMAGWLCSNGLNNSAAEGQLFYRKFTNPAQTAGYRVTRIDNCNGPEGVTQGTTPQGESGLTAIFNDMVSGSEACVKRH